MSAKFNVRNVFSLRNQCIFGVAGSIVEGLINPGMSLQLGSDPDNPLVRRIHSIELVRYAGGDEDPCLCVRCENEDEFGLLEALDIRGKTLAVFQD